MKSRTIKTIKEIMDEGLMNDDMKRAWNYENEFMKFLSFLVIICFIPIYIFTIAFFILISPINETFGRLILEYRFDV